MATLNLPAAGGRLEAYATSAPRQFAPRSNRPFNRAALAACHVVADPVADVDPWLTPALDWEATLAYRRYLFDLGLGVAEAMDTAQRGMGLDWPASQDLIRRSLASARTIPGAVIACGAGTDHLAPEPGLGIDDVIAAYEEQIGFIEGLGGRVILMASRALAAAARAAEREGIAATVLGDDLAGEAAELGATHARLAVEIAETASEPVALLSGGETAVTLPRPGFGRGGRNTEYLLALAAGLDGAPGIWAIACDTDGIDGTEDSAGAILAPDSLARAAAEGIDARAALAAHDSYGFFDALGDLVVTGPTRTNVNDFRAILIGAGAGYPMPL